MINDMLLISLLLLIISCGKTGKDVPKHDTQYWDNKRWYSFDDDRDGISNEDELKLGTNPEIINVPDFSGFTLVNTFILKKDNELQINKEPLAFEVSSKPFWQFYAESTGMSPLTGKYFFERDHFKREHLVVQTKTNPPAPNEFFLRPQINNGLAETNLHFFYKNLRPEKFMTSEDFFSLKITLNFPSSLQDAPYKKIRGELLIDEARIPWEWSKDQVSQVHWQVNLSTEKLENLLMFKEFIRLHILEWEIIQPFGIESFGSKEFGKLRPFYVLSSKGMEAGWYNDHNSLPVEKIIARPTLSLSSLPWSFLKLQNQRESQTSYWLREHVFPDIMNSNFSKTNQWTLALSEEDETNLSLPPSNQITGLKITARTVLDIGADGVEAKYHDKNGKCYATFPELLEKRKMGETDRLYIKEIAENFFINGNRVLDHLGTIFTLTYEKQEHSSAPTVISLFWPKSFQWQNFSIKGLKHDTFTLKLYNPEKCAVENSYSTVFPKYKSKDYVFEWIY